MRLHLLPTALLIATTVALQLSDFHLPISLSDYFPTKQQLSQSSGHHSASTHDLLRRQASSSSCPNKYNSCSNLGAPGLCCNPNAVCSADAAGHVACCPSGAACSGVIGGVITAGTISNGVVVGGAGGAATTSAGGLVTAAATTTTSYQNFQSASSSTNGGLVAASGTAAQSTVGGGGGFVIDGSSTVATPGAGMRRAEVVSRSRMLWFDINTVLTVLLAICCESIIAGARVPACMNEKHCIVYTCVGHTCTKAQLHTT